MVLVRAAVAALLSLLTLAPAQAAGEAGYRSVTKRATFADVRDDLKDAILKRGFVIDHTGHVKDMLDRTADVAGDKPAGGAKGVFRQAEYLLFCPAKLTHEAALVSPLAIANCPVALYVLELGHEPGTIHVGYRLPAANSAPGMAEINARLVALLDQIARDATR